MKPFFHQIRGVQALSKDSDIFTALISDLAFIFHWAEQDCLQLSIKDLVAYHENAVDIYQRANGGDEK